ncbi:N-acetyltransferase [Staphylococcus hyicus]|uniref:GNAT family N-acetyltransferase n=1 Tax=Staphylococcus hyicus TaxID=1284 RepID=UPI00057D00BD|nr:GNAT family N-acetyltransferase [Staphylococcus hyicus]AJC96700.1 N-acetyltransferase [Staphylococcus hyicus]MCE5153471.1 N-acetyltransferase [Staphylococcus hyicus]MCQ9290155.1 GNAT family N-acetyltransferase [Staphylococcus hyicus]MCQ9305396.1 GNAT family N-acetyltransferase [Staphylococcus hyicus]MCQ9307808.1 GNAT family N-acetyltransferase [Staphylococcus hyicus]
MIREATKEDIATITEIYNDAIINTTAVYTYHETTVEEREKWFENKVNGQWPIWVYDIDGDVAGFATYGTFRNWPGYQYTVEHSLYVSASYRRKRIASQLLEYMIKDATHKGFKTMIAGIDAANQGSIHLHEIYGFEAAGTLKQVGYKFNRWLDLTFYQLLLK